MTRAELAELAVIMPPLEVLYWQIQARLYAEMTTEFQRELQASIAALRGIALEGEKR